MSATAEPVGQLRTWDPGGATSPPPGVQTVAARQVLHRFAKRGTQHVVTLRCLESGGSFSVDCEVYPAGSLKVEPVKAGPYAFASEADARRFVDETTLALQYLGCDVFESA